MSDKNYKYDVFISYSNADQKVVEGICGYLERNNYRCFVAYRDISPSEVWAKAIAEAIDVSRMMIAVFSENFNISDQTDREIELAAENKIPILTFRISKSQFTGAKKYYLKNINWIDAFPNPEKAFGQLFDNVKKLLGNADGDQAEILKVQISANVDAEIQRRYCGHAYVDLGLSVKWATCNVGATKPEESGEYFAWGETETKKAYTGWNSKTYGKLLSDISGDFRYDVARARWGGSWRMPTKSELEELKNRCQWQWTRVNGVKGYKVTGPNGNSIFLPAAGCRGGSFLSRVGLSGRYWSSTSSKVLSGVACSLRFNDKNQFVSWLCSLRSYGQSVRPVSE